MPDATSISHLRHLLKKKKNHLTGLDLKSCVQDITSTAHNNIPFFLMRKQTVLNAKSPVKTKRPLMH